MSAGVTPPQMVVDEASEKLQAAILAHDINFAALFTAGLLSDRDVQLLRRYDKKDKFTQAALFEKARPRARLRSEPRGSLCARSPRPRAHGVVQVA